MKTIARLAMVCALLAAGTAQAQGYRTYRPSGSLYNLNYEVATPIGAFSDRFIKNTSWRGLSFESLAELDPQLAAGISFNFNRFSQTYPRVVTTNSFGGTLSGPVYNYADQFAVKGLIRGFLAPGPIRPYVGLGVGGVWSYAYSQSADLTSVSNGFAFILSPEAGLSYAVARGASTVGLNLAVRYNHTTAKFGGVSDAKTVSYAVGVVGAY